MSELVPQSPQAGKLLAELHREYLDWRRALNISPFSIRCMAWNDRAFIKWLAQACRVETADHLAKVHLETWLKHLAAHRTYKGHPLNPRSINKKVENARGFIRYLIMFGYAPHGLMDVLLYVKEPKNLPTSVLMHAQVRKLLAKVPTHSSQGYRNRAILELLYTSGIRAREILGLNVGDINLQTATMMVTGKGRKQRVTPIGRTALRYMETYLVAVRPYLAREPDEQAVFLNRKGKRMPYQTLRQIVHCAGQEAGLGNITAHTFRRTCTTELIRGGAGLYQVKELLGHETLDTLRPYTKLTIQDLKKTHEKCHPRERGND